MYAYRCMRRNRWLALTLVVPTEPPLPSICMYVYIPTLIYFHLFVVYFWLEGCEREPARIVVPGLFGNIISHCVPTPLFHGKWLSRCPNISHTFYCFVTRLVLLCCACPCYYLLLYCCCCTAITAISTATLASPSPEEKSSQSL